MPVLSAENHFRRGLVALVEQDFAEAASHFQSAILIERERGTTRPQMRYLSYYGLALALSNGATSEALQACETAARRDFFNPDLLLNLGKVYLLAGKTTRALAALERGLTLVPDHPAILAELRKTDRRKAPPLRMLPRDHVANRFLGRMRSSISQRARGVFSWRPATPS